MSLNILNEPSNESSVLSGPQIIAARALLKMEQRDLARLASVSVNALSAIERETSRPLAVTLDKIQRALERSGVEFTNGDQPGVRLKKAPPS